MLGLVSWIFTNYEAVKFRQLLTSGCLNVQYAAADNINPSPAIMGRIIRESGIGWERDRYVPVLEQMEIMYGSKISDEEENGDRKELYKIKGANAKFLIDIIKDVFSFLPEADAKGMISISELCFGVMKFNDKYCRVSDELDGAAKFAINNMLDETARLSNQRITIQNALIRIETGICEIKVGQSGPAPGCIHVSSFNCIRMSSSDILVCGKRVRFILPFMRTFIPIASEAAVSIRGLWEFMLKVRRKMSIARTRAAALPPSIRWTLFIFAFITADYPGYIQQRVFL